MVVTGAAVVVVDEVVVVTVAVVGAESVDAGGVSPFPLHPDTTTANVTKVSRRVLMLSMT